MSLKNLAGGGDAILLLPLVIMGGYDPSPVEHGFSISKEICLEVQPNHRYEVVLASKEDGTTRLGKKYAKYFQLVDRTDSVLMLEFKASELPLENPWIE